MLEDVESGETGEIRVFNQSSNSFKSEEWPDLASNKHVGKQWKKRRKFSSLRNQEPWLLSNPMEPSLCGRAQAVTITQASPTEWDRAQKAGGVPQDFVAWCARWRTVEWQCDNVGGRYFLNPIVMFNKGILFKPGGILCYKFCVNHCKRGGGTKKAGGTRKTSSRGWREKVGSLGQLRAAYNASIASIQAQWCCESSRLQTPVLRRLEEERKRLVEEEQQNVRRQPQQTESITSIGKHGTCWNMLEHVGIWL